MTEATKKRTQMTAAQGFQLANLVQASYVEKGLYDPEFAVWASEQLGFPVVPSNVTTARNIFGLESTLKRVAKERVAQKEARAKAPEALADNKGCIVVLNELHALQQMIAALDKRITTYFS